MRVFAPVALAMAVVALMTARPADAEVLPSDIALIEDVDGSITEAVSAPNNYLALISCAARKAGYPDRFNAIFVYTTVPLNFLTNVQQGWPVVQRTQGIGRTNWNMSDKFCTQTGVLRHAVKMGYIQTMPDNPDDRYTGILGFALSGVELVAHELGHQWLASITFDKGDGAGKHCYLRGWEGSSEPQPGEVMCDGWPLNGYNQHWSYYFNSGSINYGSMIDDLGDGKFNFYYNKPKFSQLDQYLMGLRGPGEVEPMFLVVSGDNMGSASLPIMPGKTVKVEGTRVDFTITDVIRAEGERNPPFEPCHWKGLTILVWSKEHPYANVHLNKLARYANRWEEFYAWATDGRGSFDMTIDGRGYGTATCPSALGPPPADGTQPPDQGTVAEEVQPDPGTTSEEVGPPDAFQPPDWSHIDFGGNEDAAGDPGQRDLVGDAPLPWDAFLADASCTPGLFQCVGDNVVTCRQDGSGWLVVQFCGDDGRACQDGACAISKRSGGCAAAGTGTALPAWPPLLLLVLVLMGLGIRIAHTAPLSGTRNRD